MKAAFFKLRAEFLGVPLRVGLFAAIFLPLGAKKFPLLSLTQTRKI
jgi:hypothetical protein